MASEGFSFFLGNCFQSFWCQRWRQPATKINKWWLPKNFWLSLYQLTYIGLHFHLNFSYIISSWRILHLADKWCETNLSKLRSSIRKFGQLFIYFKFSDQFHNYTYERHIVVSLLSVNDMLRSNCHHQCMNSYVPGTTIILMVRVECNSTRLSRRPKRSALFVTKIITRWLTYAWSNPFGEIPVT